MRRTGRVHARLIATPALVVAYLGAARKMNPGRQQTCLSFPVVTRYQMLQALLLSLRRG